jgi:SH3 domain protein
MPVKGLFKKPAARHQRLYSAFVAGLLCLSAGLAQAESRWVTDEFEVMLRTGKSTSQSILRQLKSGTQVEVLEEDKAEGYTRVRVGSAEGWVLTRYLKRQPTAQLVLPDLQARLKKAEAERAALQQELTELKQSRQELQSQVGSLESNNSSVQAQLDKITKLSANTIKVDEQNRQLKQRLAENERQIDLLEVENSQLASRADREWFMIGGAVLTLGLILGLIIPRISWKKKSSWSDF